MAHSVEETAQREEREEDVQTAQSEENAEPAATAAKPVRFWQRLPLGDTRSERVATSAGWLLVLLFAALAVGPGVLPGGTFLSTDLITLQSPWQSASETVTDPVHLMAGDTVHAAATTAFVVDSTYAGSFPEWDPYSVGGRMLGSVPNEAIFSPLSLPWWVLPHAMAPGGVKLMEIAAVSLGMALLFRRLNLSPAAAPYAALVYATSGYMVAWTGWPQTRVGALIPLLFWAIDRAAGKPGWKSGVAVAFVFAGMLLSGFPAVTAYALYAVVAYFFVRLLSLRPSWRQALKRSWTALAGGTAGIGLAAFQMLPFIYYAGTMVDFDVRAGLSENHDSPRLFASALVPFIQGYANLEKPPMEPVNVVEKFTYLGPVALALIVAALLIRPTRSYPRAMLLFFTGALTTVLLVIFSGTFVHDIAAQLPLVSSSPLSRMRVLIGFFGAILAGFGIHAIVHPTRISTQWRQLVGNFEPKIVAALVVRCTAVAGLTWLSAYSVLLAAEGAKDPYFALNQTLLTAVVLGIAAALILSVWVTGDLLLGAVTAISLTALTAGQSLWVVRHWWPISDADSFFPETAVHAYVDENIGEHRYANVNHSLLPGSASYYQQVSFGGHSFMAPQWADLARTVAPGNILSPTFVTIDGESLSSSAQNQILDRTAVKLLVVEPSLAMPGDVEPAGTATGQAVLGVMNQGIESPVFSGPARGAIFTVLEQDRIPDTGARIEVRAVAEKSGETLAETSWFMVGVARDLAVALDLDQLADDEQWHLEVSLESAEATLTVATDAEDRLLTSVIRPADDGLDVVFTGDATVLERATALDRVHWASDAVTIENLAARLQALSAGSIPLDTVVLSEEPDVPATQGKSSATLEVERPNTNSLSVSVTADGPGWVVIGDSMQVKGWSATLDGDPVELATADHAGAAVWIPAAGDHQLELVYRAPFFRLGLATSAVTLAVIIFGSILLAVRSRRSAGHPVTEIDDAGDTGKPAAIKDAAGEERAAEELLAGELLLEDAAAQEPAAEDLQVAEVEAGADDPADEAPGATTGE